MDILLVTATAMEMRAVLSGLPGGAARAEGSSRMCTNGEDVPEALKAPVSPGAAALPLVLPVGSCRLHPLVCGIGPVNAAFALGGRLRLMEQPDGKPFFAAVLNMGIAGTYDPDRLPLGSVAVASAEIWPEYGLADAGHVNAAGLGFAQACYRGRRVVERIELAPKEVLGSLGLGWHTPPLDCPAVTVAGCSASPVQAGNMQERTQGLMENMEGFALALGCLQYENGLGMPGMDGSAGVGPSGAGMAERFSGTEAQGLPALPFVEVRSISNVAGRRPPEGWDMPAALKALSQAAKELFA